MLTISIAASLVLTYPDNIVAPCACESVQGITMVADSTNMAAPEYAAPHTGEGKRNVQTTVLYFSGDPKVQLEPTVIGG